MRIFLKYFLWFLGLLILLSLYFIKSSTGHKYLGYLVQDYLSEQTFNNIKVDSLNLAHYPEIRMNLTVNKTANIILSGEIDAYKADMKYHLVGESFTFNDFHIDEPLDLSGKFSGLFSKLLVEGKGQLFDGNVTYRFVKVPKKIEDMKVKLEGVESQKVLTFLNKPPLVTGKADLQAHFKSFSKNEKQGEATIFMPNALIEDSLPELASVIKAKVVFDDRLSRYSGEVVSDVGSITIKQGVYNSLQQIAEANYLMDMNDSTYFQKFFQYKIPKKLSLEGHLLYDKGVIIDGYTHDFGGELSYLYKDKHLNLTLKSVSLEQLLKALDYPVLLSSQIDGTVKYDIKEKMASIHTLLYATRFRETKMSNMLYSILGVDLLSSEYDKSTFIGEYQNSILSSVLKIDDGENHIYLTEMKMNTKMNKINAMFELKMQGQELYGDIYGSLKKPQVSVDMGRLLSDQMRQQMSLFMGDKSHLSDSLSKRIEKLEVEDIADTAMSIMDEFFK